MVFANLVFIYLFLPLNLIFYFLFKNTAYRNVVLIVFSVLFYSWGEPVWIFLLILSSTLDYCNGRMIEHFAGRWQAKAFVACSLLVNFGLLGTFKYSGFLVENINALLGTAMPVPSFMLPIGISFYTFQTTSYIIDVYRGDTKAQKNPLYYFMYLSLYSQLVAGPVVRYADIAREINHRTTSMTDLSEGITRFMIGLAKKVVIANVAGSFAGKYMDGDISSLTVSAAWFGAVMFTLQIYYDFSGYSDMAIGLGRMFGFHFRENFNYPYIACSATEFWRRWHISLSSFFRDYVYIPLGGNRKHQYFNLLVVWFCTGLWHGASWNFILWGLYYGLFICLEKLFLGKTLEKLPRICRHIYLLLITVIGWVIFYFVDMGRLGQYLKAMFGIGIDKLWDSHIQITIMNNIFWFLLAILFCMPVVAKLKRFISQRLSSINISALLFCQSFMNVILLLVCTAMLVGQSYNPFLYFRF